MATAGTLSVRLTADPTGLTQGFQRSKAELAKFSRDITSASSRMSNSLTMLATHFTIVGKTGPEQLKQVASAGINLASVFGPTGMLISGIGLAGMAIVNWMTDAREEAKKTEESYRKLATTFSLVARTQAVAEFDVDPDRGGKLAKWQRQMEDAQARLTRLQQRGVMAPAGLLADIDALQQKMAPLEAARKRLVDLVTFEAQSGQQLIAATAQVARNEEQRRDALQASAKWSRDILNDLSQLSAPMKLPSVWEDLKKMEIGKPPVSGGRLPQADASAALERQKQAAEQVLSASAAAATALREGLTSAAMMASQALMSIGTQLAGGGLGSGIGAALGGGVGGALGSKLLRMSAFGFGFGGPIGAILGGIGGAFIGKAVGGLVKGIGRVFGFGKKKRGPTAEDLAAQRLRQLAEDAKKASQEILNAPKGFKAAIWEFGATIGVRGPNTNLPRGDWESDMPRSPGAPRTPGGKERDGTAKQSATFANYGTITIVANTPQEFFDQLQHGGFTTNRGGVRGYQLALTPSR